MLDLKPDLTSLTVCFWMRTDDDTNQGTAFSYANEDGDNILTLTNYDGYGQQLIWSSHGNEIRTSLVSLYLIVHSQTHFSLFKFLSVFKLFCTCRRVIIDTSATVPLHMLLMQLYNFCCLLRHIKNTKSMTFI